MFGYIAYGGAWKKTAVERRQIAGGNFLRGTVGESRRPNGLLARRKAAQVADQLYAAGVRRAVFPLDFPYMALFLQRGIQPVDTLPLRQALVVPFVRRQLDHMGMDRTKAVVAISGDRMGQALMETTRALALSYRYVLLDAPTGAEDFARFLRREYGVSLLLHPSVEQMERADARLLFAPREEAAARHSIFLALYPGGEYLENQMQLGLPEALKEALESNCSCEQMTAALYAMGVLALEDILAEIPVDRMGNYLYNAMNNSIK